MLKIEELVVLCRCVLCSLQAMCGKKSYPSILEVEKKVVILLERFGMSSTKSISLHEFQSLVLKDVEILQLMKSYHFLNSDDLREVMETETDIVECDSDVDQEIDVKYKPRTHNPKNRLKEGKALGLLNKKQEIKLNAYRELFSDQNLRPSRFKQIKEHTGYPDFSAEPTHIYGYRGYDMRNNIKFSPTSELVSFTSNVAWILDRNTNTQRIFQGHSNQISCIATFDSHMATGELADSPLIYIWQYKSMEVMFGLCGILKQGVAFLCFSNDGKRLAAMDTSENRTVVVYDFSQLQTTKTFDFNEHVLGIYKGPQKVA